jgi:putative MATE family efflux protein
MRSFSLKKIDPLSANLFAIAAPIIIQNFVHYVQLQTDMAMLGHYNSLLLAAVGNVTFPYIILVNFLMGTATGATVMIAHAIGARKKRQAQRFSEVSFFYNSLLSIPFFLILLILPRHIMSWMGTSTEINLFGSQYMHFLSFSLLFLGVEMSVAATLQGMGKTKHIMVAGILRTVVNVFLDWILIYGTFGFPELGIRGAAIATSCANAVAAVYLICTLVFSKSMLFYPGIRGILKPKWHIQKKNVSIGVPHGLEAIMWSLGQIAIIRIVNELDAISAGLYLLVVRIQSVTFFFYLGMARATMTLVGQKMGAAQPKEALRVGTIGLLYSFLMCAVASTLFLTVPEEIIKIFTSDQTFIKSASPLLSIIAITVFPVAVNVVIGSGIRGLKDTRWMFFTQILGTSFTIVVCAILVLGFKTGLKSVFFVALADESIRALLNSIRFYKGRAALIKFMQRFIFWHNSTRKGAMQSH